MKATILLLLCLVTLSCSLKIVKQNSDTSLACCGTSTSYDQNTQFCCIDTVYKITDSNSGDCCGSKPLSSDDQCCFVNEDSTPSKNDKAISADLTCCGTSGFDPSKQLCCGGKISSNSDGSRDCCGDYGKTYDTTNDLCCEGIEYDEQCDDTYGSCFKAVDATVVVVNGEKNGKQCCGSSGFNPDSQQCCNGRAVDSDLECCVGDGGGTFDSSARKCCSQTSSVTLPNCADGTSVTVSTTTARINGGADDSYTCCEVGVNAFKNDGSQLCCNGNVLSQNSDQSLTCCGSRAIDESKVTCCPQTRYSVKSDNSCNNCGCTQYKIVETVSYNSGSPAAASCCDGTPYDSSVKFCCPSDEVIGAKLYTQNSNSNLDCCGFSSYNTDNDFCCSSDISDVTYGKVFTNKGPSKTDANLDCCGTFDVDSCGNVDANVALYDTDKQSCPCGKVIDLSDDLENSDDPNVVAGCCGTTQYDAASKLCCANGANIFDEDPAIGRRCCADGKTRYNPGYQVCCYSSKSSCSKPCVANAMLAERDVEEVEQVEEVEDSKKSKKKSTNKNKVFCGDSCCDVGNGLEGYFREYQVCCGGEIVDYQGLESSPVACCGNAKQGELYNANTHTCCYDLDVSGSGCSKKASTKFGVYENDVEFCCSTSGL